MIDINRKAHEEINCIYNDILPKYGMEVRDGQIELCHKMLDAFADKSISLCHAGVGIGKTSAYIVAAVVWDKYMPHEVMSGVFSPFVIATSSIALQNAILEDYIPSLSQILVDEGIVNEPFMGILRKGKGNYACPLRLEHRIKSINPEKRSSEKLEALLALRHDLDFAKVPKLSRYDRERVAIPDLCPRKCSCSESCKFMHMLREQHKSTALFQVCNHNYLLADALNRKREYSPLFPMYRGLIIDEAHKLITATRDMCEYRFDTGDIDEFIAELREVVADAPTGSSPLFSSLLELFKLPPDTQEVYEPNASTKAIIHDCLEILEAAKQIRRNAPGLRHVVYRIGRTLKRFYDMDGHYLCYLDSDEYGRLSFIAVCKSVSTQLRELMWNAIDAGIILTSGTLAIDNSFRFVKKQLGLSYVMRDVSESVFCSPFDYYNNCLLYMPERMPNIKNTDAYRSAAFNEVKRIITATHGHTLILFTSYDDMSDTYQMLKEENLSYPLFALNRGDEQSIRAFRQSSNGILLACGRAWEGMDFPGDIVSSLIIYKLPFPQQTMLSEAQKSQYMSLRDFIAAAVIPVMQISMMQGIGRGIRLKTDTCAISILDGRAVPDGKYHKSVLSALPDMRIVSDINDVVEFIREKKQSAYFESEVTADGTAEPQ